MASTNPGADPEPTNTAETTGRAGSLRLGVQLVTRFADYRKLLFTRFAAQWGDGIFQAGLGGAVLFNPEREADPAAVAAGLAVLLLPYSIIGPFAGTLLDRWDRRRVLLVANLLRALLIVAVSAALATGADGAPLFVGALIVMAVSRFAGAGLSAALPHVVPREHLVEANAVATTLGAVVTAIGAGSAIALRSVFGAGDVGSAMVTTFGAVGALGAAAVVLTFARGALGPDRLEHGTARQTILAVAGGLWQGARAAASRPTVAASFLALIAHRAAFGITTLVGLLLMRHVFVDAGLFRAGLPGVGQLIGAAAVGVLIAAVATPRLVARFGTARAVRGALLLAAATQLAAAALLSLPAMVLAAFLVGGAGQVVKLCTDAHVQQDVDDTTRGRVFALYDTVFNAAYVLAIAAAATVVPGNGDAPWLIGLAAAVYLLGLVAHLSVHPHRSPARASVDGATP
ncbi:MFS transporter [Actinoalloteichus hymeniacidonis]|uniref:DUF894 family protein n=1 Tax=Actinoalloteichus hymeniacidonis TaxID=340345 RepID=A0AAC9HW01_9PSEU|nr:MFS transporter [Actinoalloteichus hymeniacidonis]AOS66176.1 putative DUF894 family protein [Actinoalloteichus hymeniacidonis]MBB5905721.1 MFS family permease [Actinoalloteichus hymeniacidonis]